MSKKNIPHQKYSLHTLADYVSDTKVIGGAIVVLVGTIVSVTFGVINYYIGSRNAPIIKRVEAIESRDISIEKTLVDLKDSDSTINSKLDRLLFKLVPDPSVGR